MTVTIARDPGPLEDTEKDLYAYGGYYPYPKRYHGQENVVVYIQASPGRKPRYDGSCMFPGAIAISKEHISTDSAIIFNTMDCTVTTGNCPLDMEMLRIITEIAGKLGFTEKNRDNVLRWKISKCLAENREPDFTPDEIHNMMEMARHSHMAGHAPGSAGQAPQLD